MISLLVFSTCWNPKETGSNANVGMTMRARQGQADNKQQVPSSMLLQRFPAEDVTQVKGSKVCVFLLQRQEIESPTSEQAKIMSHRCALHF